MKPRDPDETRGLLLILFYGVTSLSGVVSLQILF